MQAVQMKQRQLGKGTPATPQKEKAQCPQAQRQYSRTSSQSQTMGETPPCHL